MRSLPALLAAIALLPTAVAYPACADVTDAPPNPTGVYLLPDPWGGTEAWLETNEAPGLQRQACLRANGTVADADLPLVDIGL